jgi:DNA-binding winged helix-turn-helix (wHTH) protein/tetratricopeptide (TPR) repeat protein
LESEMTVQKSLRFEGFILDTARLCLLGPTGQVELRPKSFEVLRYLADHAGRVVSKDELIDAIWPAVTVSDASLTQCISEVRRALGSQGHRIVKTVARRGYLIDLPVVPADVAPAAAAQEFASRSNESSATPLAPHDRAMFGERSSETIPQRSESDRRQVTVLVCNLVGAATLARGMDPEDFGEILAAYRRCVRDSVERHGGFIARSVTVETFAYFGYPHAHEDDAERAVRAGLDVTRSMPTFRFGPHLDGLQAHVGIATGLVVAANRVGNGVLEEDAFIGETPLLAAHLLRLAGPGKVVVSSATRRQVGKLFEWRELEIEGSNETFEGSLVLAESTVGGRFEALRGPDASPLLGRDEELDLLRRRWEQARGGSGRVVLLTGESGIGKSRLTRAIRDQLMAQQHSVVVFQCTPHEQDSALHPIITSLARAAGIEADDDAESKLGKLEGLLEGPAPSPPEHLAILATLLSIPTGQRYPVPNLTPHEFKERVFDAMLDQLKALCTARPVFLVFEDLHWIDPSSLELLSRLVEDAASLRLLLVATARSEFRPPWANHWHISTMAPARLGRQDVEALITSIADGKALPAEILEEIVARTDGIPLFVEELTKTVLESGILRESAGRYELMGALPQRPIPSSLHASLLARLDRLASFKDIAQIGAAVGGEFSYAVIAAASDLPEPHLNAGLGQLVAAELIFQRGVPPDATYRFKHTLVQDVAYGSLLLEQRCQLHARIARVLEQRFPGLATTSPAVLAHHHGEARNLDKAVTFWTKAGRLSLDRSAMVEASGQFRKALELLPRLPATVDRDKREIDLRLLSCQAYQMRGEMEQTIDTLSATAELAKALGDELRLALTTAQLAAAQWTNGQHDAAVTSALSTLAYAERASKLPLQISATFTLANARFGQGRLSDAIALHEHIIATLERLELGDQRLGWIGLPSVMSRAFLSWYLLEKGQFERAREHIDLGRKTVNAARQPYSHIFLDAAEGLFHLRRGYPEHAVPILEPTVELCRRSYTSETVCPAASFLSMALVKLGRPAEALSIAEALLGRGAHLRGARYFSFFLFKAIAEAKAAVGPVESAMAWADKAVDVTQRANEFVQIAHAFKCRGDLRLLLPTSISKGIDDLEQARDLASRHGLAPLVSECDLSLARACRAMGRDQQAQKLALEAADGFRALDLERQLVQAERLAVN